MVRIWQVNDRKLDKLLLYHVYLNRTKFLKIGAQYTSGYGRWTKCAKYVSLFGEVNVTGRQCSSRFRRLRNLFTIKSSQYEDDSWQIDVCDKLINGIIGKLDENQVKTDLPLKISKVHFKLGLQ